MIFPPLLASADAARRHSGTRFDHVDPQSKSLNLSSCLAVKHRRALIKIKRDNSQISPSHQRSAVEPINPGDMPGYFLSDFTLARDVIDTVGAPNPRLQFDAYHASRITGDVPQTWLAMRDLVAHVQVAQTPQRSEPDKGDIDYPAFFTALDREGYVGWVSGEYKPVNTTSPGWFGLAHRSRVYL